MSVTSPGVGKAILLEDAGIEVRSRLRDPKGVHANGKLDATRVDMHDNLLLGSQVTAAGIELHNEALGASRAAIIVSTSSWGRDKLLTSQQSQDSQCLGQFCWLERHKRGGM